MSSLFIIGVVVCGQPQQSTVFTPVSCLAHTFRHRSVDRISGSSENNWKVLKICQYEPKFIKLRPNIQFRNADNSWVLCLYCNEFLSHMVFKEKHDVAPHHMQSKSIFTILLANIDNLVLFWCTKTMATMISFNIRSIGPAVIQTCL